MPSLSKSARFLVVVPLALILLVHQVQARFDPPVVLKVVDQGIKAELKYSLLYIDPQELMNAERQLSSMEDAGAGGIIEAACQEAKGEGYQISDFVVGGYGTTGQFLTTCATGTSKSGFVDITPQMIGVLESTYNLEVMVVKKNVKHVNEATVYYHRYKPLSERKGKNGSVKESRKSDGN